MNLERFTLIQGIYKSQRLDIKCDKNWTLPARVHTVRHLQIPVETIPSLIYIDKVYK